MREVADMGAGPLDDSAVGIDQRVGFPRERRDLDRKFPLEPLGAARTDIRDGFGDALERR